MARRNLTVSFRRLESYVFPNQKVAKQFELQPNLVLYFDPSDAEDSNKKFNIQPVAEIKSLKPSVVELSREGKVIHIEAEFIFVVEANEECSFQDFDDWASEEGGCSSLYFEPETDWEPNDEFEGSTYFGTRDRHGSLLAGNQA